MALGQEDLTRSILRSDRFFIGVDSSDPAISNGGLGTEITTELLALIGFTGENVIFQGDSEVRVTDTGTGDITAKVDAFEVFTFTGGAAGVGTFSGNAHNFLNPNDTTYGGVSIGQDGVQAGLLQCYGHATGNPGGGGINLWNAFDFKGSFIAYQIGINEDDLQIGPNNDADSLTHHGGTSVWQFTNAAGLMLSAGATVNEIETVLTDDATHLPASSAVISALAIKQDKEPDQPQTLRAHHEIGGSSDGLSWVEQTAVLPAINELAVMVAFKGRLLVLGGVGPASAIQTTVFASDDGVNWTSYTAGFTKGGVSDHGACVYKGQIFVAGGISAAPLAFSTDVQSSPDGIVWTKVGDIPAQRRDGAMVVFEDRMLFIAGSNSGSSNGQTEVWESTDGASWTVLGNLPDGITSVTACVHSSLDGDGDQIFVHGWDGSNGDWFKSDDGITWSTFTAPTTGDGGKLISYDGKLWYIGGDDPHLTSSQKVYISTDDGATWSEVGTDVMPIAVSHHSVEIFEGTIYSVGGLATSVAIDDVQAMVPKIIGGLEIDGALVSNSIQLATGGLVDEIETVLTDDDTHLPTSGAVVDDRNNVIRALTYNISLTGVSDGAFPWIGTNETLSAGEVGDFTTDTPISNQHVFILVNSITTGGDIVITGTSIAEDTGLPVTSDTETITVDTTASQYYQSTKKWWEITNVDVTAGTIVGIDYDIGKIGYVDLGNRDFKIIGYRIDALSEGADSDFRFILEGVKDTGSKKMDIDLLEDIGVDADDAADQIIDHLRTAGEDRSYDGTVGNIWPDNTILTFKQTDFDTFFTGDENEFPASIADTGFCVRIEGEPTVISSVDHLTLHIYYQLI